MIVWEPMARLDVVSVALPEPSSVTVPSAAPPAENVTEPDGVPTPVTVAVKVTGCP